MGSSRIMVSWPTNLPLLKKCNLIKLIFHSESEKCNAIPNFFLIFICDPRRRSSLASHWCPSRWCIGVVIVGHSLAAVVDIGVGRSVVVKLRKNAIPNLILFSFSISTHSQFPSLPSNSCPSRWCIEVVVVGRSLAVVVDVGAGRSVVVEPTLLLLLLVLCLATLTRYCDVIFMFLSFSVYISNKLRLRLAYLSGSYKYWIWGVIWFEVNMTPSLFLYEYWILHMSRGHCWSILH